MKLWCSVEGPSPALLGERFSGCTKRVKQTLVEAAGGVYLT